MELGGRDGVYATEDSAEHVRWIQRQWVVEQMEERLEFFAVGHDVNILCGTWNVNGKNAPSLGVDLREWLRRGVGGSADLIAVGLQEMVDLTAVNVVADGKSAKRADEWRRLLEQTLARVAVPEHPGTGARYELVAQRHLVGVFCAVYARTTGAVAGRVRNATSAVAGVGVMGVLGNKGGVSIRLECFDTKMCFVCAHLAAHQENVEGRNADYGAILSKTEFRDLLADEGAGSAVSVVDDGCQGILDHDMVFWLGDLNYRMSSAIATKEVFARAEAVDLDFLRSHDQLNTERKAGRVFRGFREADLTFPVTYKYEPGTSTLEQRPEKKLRAPAWCDRVLWKVRGVAKAGDRVRCVEYDSVMGVLVSDHKPVRAVFTARVLEVQPEEKRRAYDDVLKSLDGWESDAQQPEVTLVHDVSDDDGDNVRSQVVDGAPLVGGLLDFGPIDFASEATRTIRLRNVGSVVAHWRFVDTDRAEAPSNTTTNGPDFFHTVPFSKRWQGKKRSNGLNRMSRLSASPHYGTLPPNSTTTVKLTISVDTATARALNSSAETLFDVVAIHVERGAEYAILVRGEWLRSSWGMSLEELCETRGPVRTTMLAKGRTSTPESVLAVPKELWRLVDALSASASTAENLFFTPGVEGEVRLVREALDCDRELSPGASPYSLADAFTSFLASLADPIVSRVLLPRAELADPNELRRWSRDFLARLPPASYNTFVYVVVFFRELLQDAAKNQLTPAKLSAVICNCMLPNDPMRPGLDEDDPTPTLWMNTVIQYLLTTPSL